MATIVYWFKEKLKTEGITDLTLYTEKIDFDPEEPNLIVEEDPNVLEEISPAVNYKEVMNGFENKPNQIWLCPCLKYHNGLRDKILG